MIKNISALEVKKEDRIYKLYVENDSPLGEVFDVLTQMRAFVFERIKAVEEAEKAKPEEVKSEEVKPTE